MNTEGLSSTVVGEVERGGEELGLAKEANRIAGKATEYARDSRSIALGAFILSVTALLVAWFRG